jgi:hypothetical protein
MLETCSERVADLIGRTEDVVSSLTQAVGSGLGAPLIGGAPAEGSPELVKALVGPVADAVGGVARALSDALGSLLGGGAAPAPASNPMTQPLGFSSYSERITEFIERTTDAVGGALLGSGEAPLQPANKPGVPPVSPPPAVPGGAPAAPAPASYSSFLGASDSSADAFQLLFAILLLFSIALLQGGKVSYRREPLRPRSALRLAAERPG